MKSFTTSTLVLGSIIAVGAFSALAQDPAASAKSDTTFLTMADEGNSTEIAASKLALKKSKNPEVKAFAQQMITDHEKLRSDMAPFAQKMNVTAPQPLNPTHREEAKRLMALSGDDFNKEYIKAMDLDHHKTLDMFNNEIQTTSNPDLKAAVTQGQTVIQQHTQMADQLAQKMGISTM